MGNSFRTWDAWALFSVPGSSVQLESRVASKKRVEAPSLSPLEYPTGLHPAQSFKDF